ncbi:hypothetical protein [Sulfuritalea hydrogenivorans]|uniref:hypothetical protein n=1 Tax=Sulfuritalea hydrogenivorans TaxID=748811 RepID=UPI0011DD5A10|nr:hypothetical protein [Sulfuritalea hydrogenivorans]
MNRAQRLWLAGSLPLLVAIPFWWDASHLEYAYPTRPYLGTLATIGTAWAVLSLLGVRPWRRFSSRFWACATPALVALLTLAVILGAHGDRIDRWQAAGWSAGYLAFAWGVFWVIRTFGKRPPTVRAKAITYGLIAFVGIMGLFEDNYLWSAFEPRNLPYWFASLLLLTGAMLWLLRPMQALASRHTIIDITPEPEEQGATWTKLPKNTRHGPS